MAWIRMGGGGAKKKKLDIVTDGITQIPFDNAVYASNGKSSAGSVWQYREGYYLSQIFNYGTNRSNCYANTVAIDVTKYQVLTVVGHAPNKAEETFNLDISDVTGTVYVIIGSYTDDYPSSTTYVALARGKVTDVVKTLSLGWTPGAVGSQFIASVKDIYLSEVNY